MGVAAPVMPSAGLTRLKRWWPSSEPAPPPGVMASVLRTVLRFQRAARLTCVCAFSASTLLPYRLSVRVRAFRSTRVS